MFVLRSLSALVLASTAIACGDFERSETPPQSPDTTRFASERALANRLVVRHIDEPGRNGATVEIDYNALDSLARVHANHPSPLAEPLTAARVFGWAIGLSDDAEFELLERQSEAGAGSGLVIALVRASASNKTLIMRLVSDPNDSGPTLWTLNDYETTSR